MIKVIAIDEEGYFLEDVVDEMENLYETIIDGDGMEQSLLKKGLVDVESPQGLYKPKWTGTEWVEGKPLAEIEAIKNQPVVPTPLEILQQETEQLNKSVVSLESEIQTAEQKYNRLDKNITSIEDLKRFKMEMLDEACNKAIVNGFDFIVNEISYRFSCSITAQANFQGTDTLFKDGFISEAEWTVINTTTGAIERIMIDKAIFNQLKLEVFMHINSNISKLRNFLQPLVESATSIEEVDSINW